MLRGRRCSLLRDGSPRGRRRARLATRVRAVGAITSPALHVVHAFPQVVLVVAECTSSERVRARQYCDSGTTSPFVVVCLGSSHAHPRQPTINPAVLRRAQALSPCPPSAVSADSALSARLVDVARGSPETGQRPSPSCFFSSPSQPARLSWGSSQPRAAELSGPTTGRRRRPCCLTRTSRLEGMQLPQPTP